MEIGFLITFLEYLMPLLILIGAGILIASLFIIRKIIYSVYKNKTRFFWEIIAVMVGFFCASYLVIFYLIIRTDFSILILLVTFVYFVGSCFVYVILSNSLKAITELLFLNQQLNNEIDLQKDNMTILKEKSQALADANARMTKLYLDLETAKEELEKKEMILKKQNEDTTKVNAALANANSNITNLYIELEEVKEELLEKKEELLLKNKALSKSNVSLADIFKKFVPEQFLNKIAKDGIENISAGYAERTNLTIVFSDIRFFTKISENKDIKTILFILNKYFSKMSQQIYLNNGFVDKFIGDAIMSIFEDIPTNLVSHATNALNAAIGMQRNLQKINEEIKDIIDPLKIGIGIHSGEVLLGTVGLERRMDSTVLGTPVNIASRIEDITKEFGVGIIISKSTFDQINDIYKYQYRDLGNIRLRGIQHQIQLYEFFDGDDDTIRKLKYQTIPFFTRAAQYVEKLDWQKAMAEYEAALKIFPEDTAAKFLILLCQSREKK